jgi:DNA polymerase alpha subunit A
LQGEVAMNIEEQEVVEEEEEEDVIDVAEFDAKKSKLAILPTVIKGLVDKRKNVKNLLKNEKNEDRKINLDIKQKAIKLIANSIYGCMGFSNSRYE